MFNEMENTVNERVRLLIKALGISQLEASKQLGVTPSTFGKWFADGAIRTSNLKLMCSTWNVNFDWLDSGRGEMFLEGGAKVETKVSNWRDEAYNAVKSQVEDLKQENAWLRNLLSKQMGVPANFNDGAVNAFGNVSFHSSTVRAVA